MANPEHLKILKQSVEAWNEWRKKNPNVKPNLSDVDLCEADLCGANLSGTDLIGTFLINAQLYRAKLIKENLEGADLCGAYLQKAKLNDANLSYCCLVNANLAGATLTGAELYGTSRDNWEIKGLKCKYAYWGDGSHRSPKDRDLEPGEFERLYAALPTIEYIFENGMLPIDPLIMDRVMQTIREKRPEFDIKIDSINARGLVPSIKFIVQQEEYKEPALKEIKNEYEVKIRHLESERDRLYQLIAHALDSPKEIKLISAAPGSIVATDGSTVNFEQHIQNALKLQKAVTDEPEESESFAKVAKKTALEIIGEAIKDIAKGQIKESAKEIIRLGKDLGPIIANTAAYAFFKSFGE